MFWLAMLKGKMAGVVTSPNLIKIRTEPLTLACTLIAFEDRLPHSRVILQWV